MSSSATPCLPTLGAPARPKPLGMKAYGSTPHLPGSRVGPGDWHIHEGQARILTERARDGHDRIIVTEKLDGSCCAVAKLRGEIIALGRAGHLAASSPYPQHHHFARWVAARRLTFAMMLQEGERLAGEWLLQAHGTRYAIASANHLFAAFCIARGRERLPWDDVRLRCWAAGIRVVPLLWDGPPLPVADALRLLGSGGLGHAGGLDPAEGAVWRCERKGSFDFAAKFVRPGKVDGALLPSISGGEPVWNFDPAAVA